MLPQRLQVGGHWGCPPIGALGQHAPLIAHHALAINQTPGFETEICKPVGGVTLTPSIFTRTPWLLWGERKKTVLLHSGRLAFPRPSDTFQKRDQHSAHWYKLTCRGRDNLASPLSSSSSSQSKPDGWDLRQSGTTSLSLQPLCVATFSYCSRTAFGEAQEVAEFCQLSLFMTQRRAFEVGAPSCWVI